MKAKKLFICVMAFAAVIMTGCSDDEEGERISVISIELNKDKEFLKPDQTETLIATITPEEATNKNVSWNSSKPEVATVDDNGKVIALTDGETQITVTTSDGNKTATCAITVTSNWTSVTGIDLNERIISLPMGETETLVATITPDDATDKRVLWSSSNEEIASVDKDGKVTALKMGQAVITITSNDEGKTATCAISVGAPANILDFIPDPGFLAYAKFRMTNSYGSASPLWDEDGDGILSPEEAAKVSIFELDTHRFEGPKVVSFEGLDFFTGLTELGCKSQELTELDLSNNPKLKRLDCRDNKLTKLNIDNNTDLQEINCQNNLLTELNVSNKPDLDYFSFRDNLLTEIDLSNNPNLRVLECHSNKLSVLDISNQTKLELLFCYNNHLLKLNASKMSLENWNLLCGSQTSDGETPQKMDLTLTEQQKNLWETNGLKDRSQNTNITLRILLGQ